MDKKQLKNLLIGELSFKRFMRSFIFIYVCFCLWAYFFAEAKIFAPQPSSYQDNSDILKLTTFDNIKISALYLPNPHSKYTILFSHGNAEDLGDLRYFLKYLHDLGFGVFAYDYHGYGTSQGKPSEINVYHDINAAYDYLTQKLKIPPKRIILYGRSVGGGPTVDLAARQSVGGLILESTFITAFRVVTHIPIVPFDKFNNISKIKQVHCPVLVMQGKADEVIPFSHGQKLFATAQEPKMFLWVDKAGHNDVMEVAGKLYVKTIQDFTTLVNR